MGVHCTATAYFTGPHTYVDACSHCNSFSSIGKSPNGDWVIREIIVVMGFY